MASTSVRLPALPPGVKRRQAALRKGDTTELALLASLERLLDERPLTDIGIDEIAAGAGVSRATFYSYFPSKTAALTVCAHRFIELIAEDAAAFAEAVHARADGDRIKDAARPMMVQARDHFPVLRAVIEAAHQEEEPRALWSAWIESMALDVIEPDADADPIAPDIARALLWSTERVAYEMLLRSRTDEQVEAFLEVAWTIWSATLNALEERHKKR
jgi:AcrR family transcriptional regulator